MNCHDPFIIFSLFTDTLNKDTSWKRTCLAYAIQWYSPQLMTPPFSCACITQLGEILHSNNNYQTCMKYHCLYTQQKTIKLLIDIKHANFDQIERCLNAIQRDNPAAVKMVWELFKQYQKMEPESLRCSYHRMRSVIDIKPLSMYLWRNGVISDNLFEAISTSPQDKETEESLWKDLENELKVYIAQEDIIAAIADTIDDSFKVDEKMKAEMKRLIKNGDFQFFCGCSKLYFDVPRQASHLVRSHHLETDASFSENEASSHAKAGENHGKDEVAVKRRTKSRSTSASRRKSLPPEDMKGRSDSKSPKKQLSSGNQIERSPSWPPDNTVHVGKTITVDKKRSKVININNHGKGPVNVGTKLIKVGKTPFSDTSNDTESQKSSPYGSDSDTGRSVVSTVNEEIHETVNVTRSPGRLCNFPKDYRPECKVKTSTRRRTVSESSIQKVTEIEKLDTTQESLGTEVFGD